GKTDAKDAYVIAETARLRRDLSVIDTGTDLVRKLAVLTGHREDLIADRVRRVGQTRLTGWLRNRNVRGAADVAARATAAAKAQTVVLPGQDMTASIVTELATGILALDDRLKVLDAQI